MTVNVSKPVVNVREKLAELDKPTGIAGEAMLRAETPQEQFNLIGAGRRNIIINGGIQISQRGTYSSATASSHNTYTVDRWTTAAVGVNATVQKQAATLPNGWEATSTKITASTTASSGSYIGQNQTIEDGQRILRSGKTWTVSAWVKTNRNDVVVRLGGVKNVGEAAVGDGNWHYYSTTFDYTTAGSGDQGISFLTYDNGATSVTTGDYIEFTQFQLELGKVATPFEHRSYGEELALCQRYFERKTYEGGSIIAIGWSGNTSGATAVFEYTEKRDDPQITLPSPSNTNGMAFLDASGSYASTVGTNTVGSINRTQCRINGGSYTGLSGGGTASALYITGQQNIDIDAEL